MSSSFKVSKAMVDLILSAFVSPSIITDPILLK